LKTARDRFVCSRATHHCHEQNLLIIIYLLQEDSSELKDGAYFCSCAHVLPITHGIVLARYVRAGVDIIDAINCATKSMTKMKVKNSNCDEIKFNEPVLKPGTPE